jgi:hypothetical protein
MLGSRMTGNVTIEIRATFSVGPHKVRLILLPSPLRITTAEPFITSKVHQGAGGAGLACHPEPSVYHLAVLDASVRGRHRLIDEARIPRRASFLFG